MIPSSKISPIACYTFFHFVRNNQTQATLIGVTKTKNDNPVVSPNSKIIPVWNTMVRRNRQIIETIAKYKKEYPGWKYNPDMLETINELGL